MQHVVGAIGTAMLFYGVFRFSGWLALALAGLAVVAVANKMGQTKRQKRDEAMYLHPTGGYNSSSDPRGEGPPDYDYRANPDDVR